MAPLLIYYGHHWDHMKCPDWRGVLISEVLNKEVPLYCMMAHMYEFCCDNCNECVNRLLWLLDVCIVRCYNMIQHWSVAEVNKTNYAAWVDMHRWQRLIPMWCVSRRHSILFSKCNFKSTSLNCHLFKMSMHSLWSKHILMPSKRIAYVCTLWITHGDILIHGIGLGALEMWDLI